MATAYRPAYRPMSRREMAKRRRQHVFVLLGAAAAVTLVGYLATGNSTLFALHMVADLVGRRLIPSPPLHSLPPRGCSSVGRAQQSHC